MTKLHYQLLSVVIEGAFVTQPDFLRRVTSMGIDRQSQEFRNALSDLILVDALELMPCFSLRRGSQYRSTYEILSKD